MRSWQCMMMLSHAIQVGESSSLDHKKSVWTAIKSRCWQSKGKKKGWKKLKISTLTPWKQIVAQIQQLKLGGSRAGYHTRYLHVHCAHVPLWCLNPSKGLTYTWVPDLRRIPWGSRTKNTGAWAQHPHTRSIQQMWSDIVGPIYVKLERAWNILGH